MEDNAVIVCDNGSSACKAGFAGEEIPDVMVRSYERPRIVVMFELFNTPYMYIAMQAVLCHYANGRVTGIVTDIGDGVAQTVPIYEGCSITHAITQQELAGKDVTDYLNELLSARGYSFSTPAEREIVNCVKRELGYVALDYETESAKASTLVEKSFKLPDGQTIQVGSERFESCEVLFRPQLQGLRMRGLHESILNSFLKCDIDARRDLRVNIMLSGGTSVLPGFRD